MMGVSGGNEKPVGTVPTLAEHNAAINEKLNPQISPNMDGDLSAALNSAILQESANAGPVPPLPGAPGAAGPNLQSAANIAGWKNAVVQVVPMVEAMIPEFKRKVNPAQWESFGQALGECMDHYGLGLGEALNHPLARLIVAGVPIGMAAMQIKSERVALELAKKRPASITDSQESAKAQSKGEPEIQRPGSIETAAAMNADTPGVTYREMTADIPASAAA